MGMVYSLFCLGILGYKMGLTLVFIQLPRKFRMKAHCQNEHHPKFQVIYPQRIVFCS
jgi:hypothetical protein